MDVCAYGQRFDTQQEAEAFLRTEPGTCPVCGHDRHDMALAPCGAYAEGAPGCRCMAVTTLVAHTSYSLVFSL